MNYTWAAPYFHVESEERNHEANVLDKYQQGLGYLKKKFQTLNILRSAIKPFI